MSTGKPPTAPEPPHEGDDLDDDVTRVQSFDDEVLALDDLLADPLDTAPPVSIPAAPPLPRRTDGKPGLPSRAPGQPPRPPPASVLTAQPPAINPAGPPPRQPYPPAVSPRPPSAAGASNQPALDDEDTTHDASLDDFLESLPPADDADDGADPTQLVETISEEEALGAESMSPFLAEHSGTLTPPPPATLEPFSPTGPRFEGEQRAADWLGDDAADEWRQRAAFLEAQAGTIGDAATRSRTYLVASELHAQGGDVDGARRAARRAAEADPAAALPNWQRRALDAEEDGWDDVSGSLQVTAASDDVHLRTHALVYLAELRRLGLTDGDHREALRQAPGDGTDLRASLALLVDELTGRGPIAPPDSGDDLATAARATLHSWLEDGDLVLEGPGPLLRLDRLLEGEDHSARLTHLEELAGLGGYRDLSLWLKAADRLAATDASDDCLEVLGELVGRQGSTTAHRAFLEGAILAGSGSALRKALTSVGPLGDPADGAVLGAVTGDAGPARELVASVDGDDPLRPLVVGLATALAPGKAPPQLFAGSPEARRRLALGRAMACVGEDPTTFRFTFEVFRDEEPDSPVTRLLTREVAMADAELGDLARELADDIEAPEGERLLAAGLLHELAGNVSAAADVYEQLIAQTPDHEGAVRALIDGDRDRATERLLALADAVEDPEQQSLLYVEAALRRGTENPELFDALLDRAASVDATLPFAHRLGEEAARSRGDAGRVVHWLQERRRQSTDAFETALDLVREAAFVAEDEPEAAQLLLTDALEHCPDDLALRELATRLGASTDDLGTYLDSLADRTSAGGARLLRQMAFLRHRRMGHRAAALATGSRLLDSPNTALPFALEELAGADAADELVGQLTLESEGESDVRRRASLLDRLARLQERRGQVDDAIARLNEAISLESWTPARARTATRLFARAGRAGELAGVANHVLSTADPSEAFAHGRLAHRIGLRDLAWDDLHPLVELTGSKAPTHPWTLRSRLAHHLSTHPEARPQVAEEMVGLLIEASDADLETAPLLLLRARVRRSLGDDDGAKEDLATCIDLLPEYLPPRLELLDLGRSTEDHHAVATQLTAVADHAAVKRHALDALDEAATVWLVRLGDKEEARLALERAFDLDPKDHQLFERLRKLLLDSQQPEALAVLLERRLEASDDDSERAGLELLRARTLVQLGDTGGAREALHSALDHDPSNVEALEGLVDLALAEDDPSSASDALRRIDELAERPVAQRIETRLRLAELQAGPLDELGAAEVTLRGVLELDATHGPAREALARVLGKLGEADEARQLHEALGDEDVDAETHVRRVVARARFVELEDGDRRTAEGLLERTRRTHPTSSVLLRALAELYARHDDTKARNVLVERATKDARRGLAAGRFELDAFHQLAVIAELEAGEGAGAPALAMVQALEGETHSPLDGGGPRAGNRDLDDLLAPDTISLPLRALLARAGNLLDQAFPADLPGLRATAPPDDRPGYLASLDALAQSFGLAGLEVYVSPVVGAVCLPVSSNPGAVVVGQALWDHEDSAVRDFLVLRALKVLQARGGALLRAAPIELWPLVAAFLAELSPGWSPATVDADRFAAARERLAPLAAAGADADIRELAGEVATTLGARASALGTAMAQWGNRTALLATGDLNVAFQAIAAALGQTKRLPLSGPERLKWLARTPETRDLVQFAVSSEYRQLLERLRGE